MFSAYKGGCSIAPVMDQARNPGIPNHVFIFSTHRGLLAITGIIIRFERHIEGYSYNFNYAQEREFGITNIVILNGI